MSISAYISVLAAIIVPIAAITAAYMAYRAEREADALSKRAMVLASEASRLAFLAIESVASSRASRLAEEATLSIAKAANRLALYAIIIAAIGSIISIKSEIYALVLMLLP